MTPSLSVSVAGLQDAASRLSTSASRVIRSATPTGWQGFGDLASRSEISSNASLSGPARTSDLSGTVASEGVLYTPSYSEDVISMRLAVQAYKANAKMIKTHAEMADELLSAIGKAR